MSQCFNKYINVNGRLTGLLMNDLEQTLTTLTVSQTQMERPLSNLESCLMMTSVPTSLKLWSERWKRPSERRSSRLKGSYYCKEFTTTLMLYYCRTEFQSFLNLSEKVQKFLTCHCHILIWKYTWECDIFVYCIGIFLYSHFFSQGSDLHTKFFWKVAIVPVQTAQNTAIPLKYIITVIVCMIMFLGLWMNSSNIVFNLIEMNIHTR